MSSSTQHTAVSLQAHALSTAQRLLGGTGKASLMAYRIDSAKAIDVLAHGLTADGAAVVAVRRSEAPMLSQPVDVRFDIQREAAEAQVRILAATIHLLGSVEWTCADDPMIADLNLPEQIEWALAETDSMLGILQPADRVMVHDGSGVAPIPFSEIATSTQPSFPSRAEELDAHDVVRALPGADLRNIHQGVVDQRLNGRILSVKATPNGMPRHFDEVFCVDVDSFGIQLMHVGPDNTTVSFAGFAQPANDVDELSWRTLELLLHSRP